MALTMVMHTMPATHITEECKAYTMQFMYLALTHKSGNEIRANERVTDVEDDILVCLQHYLQSGTC